MEFEPEIQRLSVKQIMLGEHRTKSYVVRPIHSPNKRLRWLPKQKLAGVVEVLSDGEWEECDAGIRSPNGSVYLQDFGKRFDSIKEMLSDMEDMYTYA